MLKAFKYCLFLTEEQTILLNKYLGCVRFMYLGIVGKNKGTQFPGRIFRYESVSKLDKKALLALLTEKKPTSSCAIFR